MYNVCGRTAKETEKFSNGPRQRVRRDGGKTILSRRRRRRQRCVSAGRRMVFERSFTRFAGRGDTPYHKPPSQTIVARGGAEITITHAHARAHATSVEKRFKTAATQGRADDRSCAPQWCQPFRPSNKPWPANQKNTIRFSHGLVIKL